jgi:hypothetical protein
MARRSCANLDARCPVAGNELPAVAHEFNLGRRMYMMYTMYNY